MVDKVIALGLIDVRDIEEVGTGPLMEELGLDEAVAQRIVDRCAEEAKIVAVEQEAKKAAEAKAKAADRAAMLAGRRPSARRRQRRPAAAVGGRRRPTRAARRQRRGVRQPAAPAGDVARRTGRRTTTRPPGRAATPTAASRRPDARAAGSGRGRGAGDHRAQGRASLGSADELSPEEQAIQGVDGWSPDADADEDRKDYADEDADTAALAEGRVAAAVDAATSRLMVNGELGTLRHRTVGWNAFRLRLSERSAPETSAAYDSNGLGCQSSDSTAVGRIRRLDLRGSRRRCR